MPMKAEATEATLTAPARQTLGLSLVTYNRPDGLRNYLGALTEQTRQPDVIVVIDNADCARTRGVARDFQDAGVDYVNSGANLGSAGGWSRGFERLLEHGVDLLMSGDDDDPPRGPDTVRILTQLMEADRDLGGTGAVGSRWDWSRGRTVRYADDELVGLLPVDVLGQGHLMTVRRGAVLEIGPPLADLFFGYPDVIYSLRLRKAGYKLAVSADLLRSYRKSSGRLGVTVRRKVIPRRGANSCWRDYYTTRNLIYSLRQDHGENGLAARHALRCCARAAGAWMKGPRYGLAYGTHVARGIVDGYRGRLGQVVAPRAKDP